jgi:hypothetical protein
VTDATKETLYTALRDYGFSVVVALAAGWVLRNDVLIPLVEEHRTFVRSLSETQSEISKAVTEQTKLLYEMKHMRENP